MSQRDVEEIIHQLDYKKNHKINYTEFMSATIDVSKFLTEEKLGAIFKAFDLDNTGNITA